MSSNRRWLSHGTPARFLAVGALCIGMAAVAEAREAHCFTTDDGSFPCDFRMTDQDGSFQISAPGKPTYILNMSEKDVAFGFAGLGARNTALPGRYVRSRDEPGCWVNDTTSAKICAK
jgi:hypothetical protein